MIKIVTDSSCDLPERVLKEYDIIEIPMNVFVDGRSYKENVDLHPEEYWRMMAESEKLPKTSQPSPKEFTDIFRDILAEGDTPLCITISSKLSGTFQSATVAAQSFRQEVVVFDSLAGSLSHGVQVLKAARLLKAGKSLQDVLAELKAFRDEVNIIIPLFTVENIVKGGRLNKVTGSLVKFLNIKVLAEGIDGKVEVRKKVRGRKRFIHEIERIIDSLQPSDDKIFGITHVDNQEDAEYFASKLKEKFDNEVILEKMGPVMATYAGNKGLILSL